MEYLSFQNFYIKIKKRSIFGTNDSENKKKSTYFLFKKKIFFCETKYLYIREISCDATFPILSAA